MINQKKMVNFGPAKIDPSIRNSASYKETAKVKNSGSSILINKNIIFIRMMIVMAQT
jgi:hypothetical protein